MTQVNVSREKGFCRFKGMPTELTVGDVFEMHCEWPLSVILSSPVHIEFYKTEKEGGETEAQLKSPYSLVVLDTVNILPGQGVFKVTSYHPGQYNTGFNIVSDQGTLEVWPVSWKVASVIPKEKAEMMQPYPPYGPWKEPLPIWYWPVSVLSLVSLLAFLVVKISVFVRRKKKREEVQDRLKGRKPFREFISQLNLLIREVNTEKGKKIIEKLNAVFCVFLENEFFIFAVNERPEKIVRQLKRYHPFFRKDSDTLEFLKEIQKLSLEKVNFEDCEQMLNRAREIAISYMEGERKK